MTTNNLEKSITKAENRYDEFKESGSKTKQKILKEFRGRLFKAIVGTELCSKPINGRIIALELGKGELIRSYETLNKMLSPIITKTIDLIEKETREQVLKEVEEFAENIINNGDDYVYIPYDWGERLKLIITNKLNQLK